MLLVFYSATSQVDNMRMAEPSFGHSLHFEFRGKALIGLIRKAVNNNIFGEDTLTKKTCNLTLETSR